MELHARIGKLLLVDETENALKKCANEDWLGDANFAVAGGVLPLRSFHNSMFELADLWTEGMDPVRYARFLDWVFKHALGHDPPEPPTNGWEQLSVESSDEAASQGTKTKVGKSKIHGKGLFATIAIIKGEKIIEYKGGLRVNSFTRAPYPSCEFAVHGLHSLPLKVSGSQKRKGDVGVASMRCTHLHT